jgi:hypothetical protein
MRIRESVILTIEINDSYLCIKGINDDFNPDTVSNEQQYEGFVVWCMEKRMENFFFTLCP